MITSSNGDHNLPDDVDPDGVVGRAANKAYETVDRAAQSAQEGCNRLSNLCEEIADMPRSTIRENPIAAVTLALSVGYLLGRLGR
ncbi:hypothetical protein [Xylophilus ampelinus]|uniref:ElaB/YqjD/DUF883 family membrane-anchored ribosome-binding protein n=1 Tax=Xylophilus ampelinus TaxID=54067 RepID=A0A318SKG8_9BURK|nr:hypothetical protein [Xylophilus ampelinus]MCS4508864.1 hypothetical protein [Xylophilus ampelinus]PYE79435.1 hypothetical protein DFQ15_102168 [Xylophilus ampelinus]